MSSLTPGHMSDPNCYVTMPLGYDLIFPVLFLTLRSGDLSHSVYDNCQICTCWGFDEQLRRDTLGNRARRSLQRCQAACELDFVACCAKLTVNYRPQRGRAIVLRRLMESDNMRKRDNHSSPRTSYGGVYI